MPRATRRSSRSRTGISRVVGLAREIIVASYLRHQGRRVGVHDREPRSRTSSRSLFAQSALSAAFVPVFTELLQHGRRRKRRCRLASTLFWIMLIGLGAITAFFMLAAGVIMPIFIGPTFNSALVDLTVGLSRVLFPVVLLLGLNGLLVGILQSY